MDVHCRGKELPVNSVVHFLSDPSDPSPPKDKPTKLPFPPKNDGKESYNPNEVLEKPGEFTYLHLKSWEKWPLSLRIY